MHQPESNNYKNTNILVFFTVIRARGEVDLCSVRFNLNLAFSELRDHERHLAAFTSVFW